ncbi:MAG: hypothetical protein MUF34_22710, partial [Polyangiaceae bacterium]|nr:hypothetical protein [Polyangiaceae bacterium]
EDSLDQKVDETRYPEPLLQRVLRTIERSHLSPHEAFLVKEEAGWESAKREARGEGKEEGLREGKEEGLREGEARGKAEGLREGKATALRTVLAARGFEVDAAVRTRIEGCEDPARLDRWLARALTAASASEALDDETP